MCGRAFVRCGAAPATDAGVCDGGLGASRLPPCYLLRGDKRASERTARGAPPDPHHYPNTGTGVPASRVRRGFSRRVRRLPEQWFGGAASGGRGPVCVVGRVNRVRTFSSLLRIELPGHPPKNFPAQDSLAIYSAWASPAPPAPKSSPRVLRPAAASPAVQSERAEGTTPPPPPVLLRPPSVLRRPPPSLLPAARRVPRCRAMHIRPPGAITHAVTPPPPPAPPPSRTQ